MNKSTIISHRADLKRRVISEPAFEWKSVAIDKFKELCDLQLGWDGYNAGPVTFENAYFAMEMLKACCGPDAPIPSIVPGFSGDLQIEWHENGVSIELHVLGPYNVQAWHKSVKTPADGENVHLINDFMIVAKWLAEITEHNGLRTHTAAAG